MTKPLRLNILLLVWLIIPCGKIMGQDGKIHQAFLKNQISRTQMITLLGYRLFAPERLSVEYLPDLPQALKCGTSVIAQIRKEWAFLNESDRTFFSKVLSRPVLDYSYVSPSGLFRLHYDMVGINTVPTNDLDFSSVPDYIEEAALIFESSYRLEIDTLGYQPPPSDFDVDGPEIDVYFMDVQTYGYTDFDQEITSTPYNDYSSYMTLDNDFQGNQYFTKGLDAVRVTAAHELFHVIQMGYHYRDMDRYFWEMSAVWMEDRAYDAINDYYQYLPSFLLNLNLPLSYENGIHEYGSALFLKFIGERFSEGIIRRTWENIRTSHSMYAMDTALGDSLSSMAAAFVEFGIWNYFTNDRTDNLSFYKDAANYPRITIEKILSFASDTTVIDSSYFLSLRYSRIRPKNSGRYAVFPSHPNPNLWQTGIILDLGIGDYVTKSFPGNTVGDLEQVNAESDVILIAANVEIPDQLDLRLFQLDKLKYVYEIKAQPLVATRKVYPSPYRPSESASFYVKIMLPEGSDLDCNIMTENGRSVRKIPLGTFAEGDLDARIPWDGRDENNNLVASGVYICIISGKNLSIPVKIAVLNP